MATYHLSLKVHSRTGKSPDGTACRNSIVAKAAYRCGGRLFDQYQGRWYEYERDDVVHSEIMAPDGAGAPAWVFDRQTLWNMVERAEKRVDAQLAREVEFSLPRELPLDAQIGLVREFVRSQFVAKGMIADISIHQPIASDGGAQPHVHALLTLRRLDPASPTGFDPKKERDWNEREDVARAVAEARKRFNNTHLPEDKEALAALEAQRQVNVWRAQWAVAANRALERVGSDARIDHRTLEAQGIMRAPQRRVGLARHMVERAYGYMRERITNWVAIKKRTSLYREVEHYERRDPAKLAEFLLRLGDLSESFAAQFRRPAPIPEVSHDR